MNHLHHLSTLVADRKWNMERADRLFHEHLDICVLCRTSSQTALNISCLQGQRLKKAFDDACDVAKGKIYV